MPLVRAMFAALIILFSVSAAYAETNIPTPAQSTVSEIGRTVITDDFWSRVTDLDGKAVIWDAACCKVCRKGKACGNSCIKKTYTCHKGRGCACDG